jgi:hypothetical protein
MTRAQVTLALLMLALCLAAPAATLAQEPPPTEDARPALTALLERYAHEPSVGDVVKAAIGPERRHAEQLSSMSDRARLRGLVPSVELGARRGQGMDLRPAGTSAEVEGVRLSTDDDLVLEAALRFELGRLMFADEEVGIAREARAARGGRDERVRQVVELYFRRKRLLLERDLSERRDVNRDMDHEVRIAEAEALLDAFTGGAFRRMMAASKHAKHTWTTDAPKPVTPSP